MGPTLLLSLLLGCPGQPTITDSAPLSDDPSDTNDTNDTDDTGVEDSDWWDERWPYRIALDLVSQGDVNGHPAAPMVDLGAALALFDDPSGIEPDSLRIVARLESETVVLPAQLLDDYADLLAEAPLQGEPDDDAGAVAFVVEGLPAGPNAQVHLYFGSRARNPGDGAAQPVPAANVGQEPMQLRSGPIAATFDPERGGLLSAFSWNGSASLTSQADSEYGNGLNGQAPPLGWQMCPQDFAGDLSVLAEGPVVAGLSAAGVRANDDSAYVYSYSYWVFAGRPELWVRLHAMTTRDSLEQHPDDFTRGMRPWQSRQDALVDMGETVRVSSEGQQWGAVGSGDLGVVFAWLHPPAHHGRIVNTENLGYGQAHYFFYFEANDFMAEGAGTPFLIPSETAFFDDDILVLSPWNPAAGEAVDVAAHVQDRLQVVVGEPEQAPTY